MLVLRECICEECEALFNTEAKWARRCQRCRRDRRNAKRRENISLNREAHNRRNRDYYKKNGRVRNKEVKAGLTADQALTKFGLSITDVVELTT